jgi:hypothetical protein
MERVDPIQSEIKRLSLRVAVARYDLEESIMNGVPVSLCSDICKEIAICLLQRSALQRGSFRELPYNVKLLFNS